MAVQILDSISAGHEALKNETRAEIVKMLLSSDTKFAHIENGVKQTRVRRAAGAIADKVNLVKGGSQDSPTKVSSGGS